MGFVEILLGIRVALRFLLANQFAIVVELLYRLTDIVMTPFRNIFSDLVLSNGSVVDLAALSAMVGYPIVVYLFIVFLELVVKEKKIPVV